MAKKNEPDMPPTVGLDGGYVHSCAGKSAKSSPRLAAEIQAGAGASFGRGMDFSGILSVNPARATKGENLEQLKQQARALKQELEVLESRIKELE